MRNPTSAAGHKRLFRARGCSIGAHDQIIANAALDDWSIRVYIGNDPPLGIATRGPSDRYLEPGVPVASFGTTSFGSDALRDNSGVVFTEILATQSISDRLEVVRGLDAGEETAVSDAFAISDARRSEAFDAIELAVGLVARRLHKQFVLELLSEEAVVFKTNGQFVHRISTGSLRALDAITLTPPAQTLLQGLLDAVAVLEIKDRRDLARSLTWLNRARDDENPYFKFMSLMIVAELLLAGFGKQDPDFEKQVDLIDELITAATEDNPELLKAWQVLRRTRHVPVLDRFTRMAETYKLPNWESDVRAFRSFNKLRNQLLHRGEQSIANGKGNRMEIERSTGSLSALVQKYFDRMVFGDQNRTDD